MKAVLLAAGFGTRMRGAFGDVPKILVPFGARTLLDHQLEYLAGEGVDEVAVNLHHHADAVVEHLGRGPRCRCGSRSRRRCSGPRARSSR